MRTVSAPLALASLLAATTALTGCFGPECTHLEDCPTGEVCTADGLCVGHASDYGTSARTPRAPRASHERGRDDAPAGALPGAFPDDARPWILGDIGPVHGLDGLATVSGYSDGVSSSVSAMVWMESGDDGLVIFNFGGTLAELPEGTTHVSVDDGEVPTTYVQLCSDSMGGVHFDGFANDADVTVTVDDDDRRTVEIDATIVDGFAGADSDDGPTRVHARFSDIDVQQG